MNGSLVTTQRSVNKYKYALDALISLYLIRYRNLDSMEWFEKCIYFSTCCQTQTNNKKRHARYWYVHQRFQK